VGEFAQQLGSRLANRMSQPISLLICALGGEGGGLLSEWLMHTARLSGHPAQSTSIPGVAQRTGATTYYIEVLPTPLSQLQGKTPVFSLNPVPGALDALVSSELLETTRQITLGMVSPERTQVFSSNARALTTLERMNMGDGRLDSAQLTQVVQQFSKEAHVWDFGTMAQTNGTMVSAVMLGVIAGSGLLPFSREHYEATLKDSGAHSAASLKGFAAAFARLQNAQTVQAMLNDDHPDVQAASPVASSVPPALQALPADVRELARLGYSRLCDYQSRDYADLYVERLQTVVKAEALADAQHTQTFPASRETARWLALWMAFDDIVRVADLKSRASRWQRVAREVKLQDDDLLHLYDHFKPGVPEFAALLPTWLATPLQCWDKRRALSGQASWALPLKIGTHSVVGMLALRTLAGLKWLRPFGSRFHAEQADITQWLQAICTGLQQDGSLGHEVAMCGRLIKGYGSTNERGRSNLQHILTHLAASPDHTDAAWRTHAVAQAREAALQDEAGTALDQQLRGLGVATRPVAEQPLRFVRNASLSTKGRP
jgi:indolepyruvate ferredoxin oxidoreductase, beta subunit